MGDFQALRCDVPEASSPSKGAQDGSSLSESAHLLVQAQGYGTKPLKYKGMVDVWQQAIRKQVKMTLLSRFSLPMRGCCQDTSSRITQMLAVVTRPNFQKATSKIRLICCLNKKRCS